MLRTLSPSPSHSFSLSNKQINKTLKKEKKNSGCILPGGGGGEQKENEIREAICLIIIPNIFYHKLGNSDMDVQCRIPYTFDV